MTERANVKCRRRSIDVCRRVSEDGGGDALARHDGFRRIAKPTTKIFVKFGLSKVAPVYGKCSMRALSRKERRDAHSRTFVRNRRNTARLASKDVDAPQDFSQTMIDIARQKCKRNSSLDIANQHLFVSISWILKASRHVLDKSSRLMRFRISARSTMSLMSTSFRSQRNWHISSYRAEVSLS